MSRGFQPSAFSLQLLLAIASSLLLVVSFPKFNLEFLAWVALVPLSFAIRNEKPSRAFLLSYITGVLFFLGTIYWLIHVTLPGTIAVVLYLALYFGLFGIFFSRSLSRVPYSVLLFAPSAWVALEWLRSNGPAGFGWALFAHSQSANLPVIQIADVTGIYGVSFLIVMANSAIFLIIEGIRKKRDFTAVFIIATSLIFASLAYGQLRLNNIFTGEPIRVSVIQGNISQDKKWDYDFREEILAKYEDLTRQAAAEGTDLVVWPETSVPGFIDRERDLFERVRDISTDLNKPILVGAPREDDEVEDMYYNSAMLFGADGTVIDRYDKLHLVPFGEYIPFKKALSFIEKFASRPIGDFSSGKDYTVFKFFIERSRKTKDSNWRLLKKVRFSSLICFEDIFPDLARNFVREGALFLVNITNDAWFKDSSAPYQHAQSSVFRAVENRTSVLRAANTGLSCFIDQKGRVTASVAKDGREIFVDGFRTHEITLTATRTFYNRYGDVFAYFCIMAVLFYILKGAIARKR